MTAHGGKHNHIAVKWPVWVIETGNSSHRSGRASASTPRVGASTIRDSSRHPLPSGASQGVAGSYTLSVPENEGWCEDQRDSTFFAGYLLVGEVTDLLRRSAPSA